MWIFSRLLDYDDPSLTIAGVSVSNALGDLRNFVIYTRAFWRCAGGMFVQVESRKAVLVVIIGRT
jgi:hypothetical protein